MKNEKRLYIHSFIAYKAQKLLGKENTLQSVETNIDGLEYGGTSQEAVPAR